jgi:cysteine desulfurase
MAGKVVRVYADNNAGTFECSASIAKRMELDSIKLGNPSSPHEEGMKAHLIFEVARQDICGLTGVPKGGYNVFTSGSTESNRLAILGGLHAASLVSGGNKRVITTNFEHTSVSAVANTVSRDAAICVDSMGQVPPKKLMDEASDQDVGVIAIILAHNELGVIQDMEQLKKAVKMARRNREYHHHSSTGGGQRLLFHYDAAQMLGKGPFSLEKSGADTAAWSSHKFHGPAGVGGLLMRCDDLIATIPTCCQTSPHGQEKTFRSGTENVCGCVCAAAALQSTIYIGIDGKWEEMRRECADLAAKLSTLDGVSINAHPGLTNALCNTIHLSLPTNKVKDGVHAVETLDRQYGIACSTGSACLVSAPSLSLSAIGLTNEQIKGGIRLSFSLHASDIHSEVERVHLAIRSLLS